MEQCLQIPRSRHADMPFQGLLGRVQLSPKRPITRSAACNCSQSAHHAADLPANLRLRLRRLARQLVRFRPYLQMSNLTNTGYEEVVNVRMSPRGFVGGFEIVLTKPRGGS